MGHPKKMSYENFKKLTERMELSHVTSGIVFFNIEQDYLRLSQNDYIIKEEFLIDDKDLNDIREKVLNKFEYDVMPLCNFEDFDDLPDIGYQWNEFLLGTILENMYQDIHIIYPIIKDRRYQKGIATLKSGGLGSYAEIVAYTMISNGIESLSDSQFMSFLVIHGLANKAIPKELMNSNYIKFDNDRYIVQV
jgi:hypothetical protein